MFIQIIDRKRNEWKGASLRIKTLPKFTGLQNFYGKLNGKVYASTKTVRK